MCILDYRSERDLACTLRISEDWTEALSGEHACHHGTGGTEAEGSGAPGQPRLCDKTLSQKRLDRDGGQRSLKAQT